MLEQILRYGREVSRNAWNSAPATRMFWPAVYTSKNDLMGAKHRIWIMDIRLEPKKLAGAANKKQIPDYYVT